MTLSKLDQAVQAFRNLSNARKELFEKVGRLSNEEFDEYVKITDGLENEYGLLGEK